jgi:putative membrane protein
MKNVKLLLLLLAGTLAAHAQAPDPDTTARHFLIMASLGNLQEVNAGTLAAQKADKADIQAFGAMMVTDHTKLEQQLLQLADDGDYDLPPAATEKPVKDPHLVKADGADFDRMYIHSMAAGHRSTVMMFQNYAITGKSPAVKAFAAQALPMLKEHLAAIEALDKKYADLVAE